jgi:predicted phage terminase large subunit-like protein
VGPEQPKKNLFTGLLAQRKRERARTNFQAYCQHVYPLYKPSRHLKFIISNLERIEAGQQLRTTISTPPQHGKSWTATILFSCWALGRDPRRKIVAASYGDDRAQDLGRWVLRFLRDTRHKEIFPECEIDENAASSTRIDLLQGGGFLAVSRNGALTGRSADFLLIDDVLKDAKEAASAAIRRDVVDWYTRVALTRLSPTGSVLLIGTRWGCGDLFDYLLTERQEEHWVVINLPAIAGPKDQLGRREGEALWPEMYNVDILAQKRAEVGSAAWVCLYQGEPAASEGAIWHREHWQYYVAPPEKFTQIIVSVDTAFKTGQHNDYSVMQCWGRAERGYYLLATLRGKWEFPELQTKLIAFAAEWSPHWVLIEDAASGQSLLQSLEATSLPLKKIKVDRDKIARAQACTPQLESGRVFLPQGASWLDEFLDEASAFPRATHDDQVDACSQALNFFREDGSVLNWWPSLMGAAHALGQKATDAQKAMLATFESRGAPSSAPYYPPTSLADAQKMALPPESPGSFRSIRERQLREAVQAQAAALPMCPVCGSPASAVREVHWCNSCGWKETVREPDSPSSSSAAVRDRPSSSSTLWFGGG